MKSTQSFRSHGWKKFILFSLAVLHNQLVFAQVTVTTNGAATKASSIMAYFVNTLIAVGYGLCVGAMTLLAYRAWAEPNFKIADGKNILIGGIIFGAAATIGTYFTS